MAVASAIDSGSTLPLAGPPPEVGSTSRVSASAAHTDSATTTCTLPSLSPTGSATATTSSSLGATPSPSPAASASQHDTIRPGHDDDHTTIPGSGSGSTSQGLGGYFDSIADGPTKTSPCTPLSPTEGATQRWPSRVATAEPEFPLPPGDGTLTVDSVWAVELCTHSRSHRSVVATVVIRRTAGCDLDHGWTEGTPQQVCTHTHVPVQPEYAT